MENAILNYAVRVYGENSAACAQEFVLEQEDFPLPDAPKKADKTITIGFGR